MPPLRTTLGQILINESLPEDLRDYNRVMNAKAIKEVLDQVAEKHPDRYREVSHQLLKAGRSAAYTTGGLSFGLNHMQTSAAYAGEKEKLNQTIDQILRNPGWSSDQKNAEIIKAVSKVHYDDDLASKVLKQGVAEQNPLALQVLSGGRGNPAGLKRLIAADGLYQDHQGSVIPIAILNSYSHGVDPAEFLAATFGARQGLVDTKLGTAKGGYLSKQMSNAVHRLIVSAIDKEDDADEEPNLRGLLTETSDMDNVGALLSAPAGGYDRNTVITPRVLKDLKSKGINKVVVRSPLSGGPRDGGLYARDVGVSSRMSLPSLGESVGIPASQSLSEKIIQTSLSSKHRGGAVGKVGGFNLLNQMINIPKEYPSGAAHAELDGRVSRIDDASLGGKLITIDNKQHYVPVGFEPLVKVGDEVEAGDVLSDGVPNPAKVVAHKGIGEGRRYFVRTYMQALADSGIKAKRRNVELLARGLIDHVQADDEFGGYFPGDTVSYSDVENSWEPRPGTMRTPVSHGKGQYLERPVLHYSLGTKIRPSVIKELQEAGVKDIDVNPEPMPFSPLMVRAIDSASKDSDWMTRMLGGGAEKSMLKAVHLGQSTDPRGTSYVPGLSLDPYNFGRQGKIQNFTTPEANIKLAATTTTKIPGLAQPPEPPQPAGMTPSANSPFSPQLPTTGTTVPGPNISSSKSVPSAPATSPSSSTSSTSPIGVSGQPSGVSGPPKLNAQLNQAPPVGAAQRLTPTPAVNGSNRGVGNNSLLSPKIKGPPSSFQDLMGTFKVDDLSFNPDQFLKNLGQSTRPLIAPAVGQAAGLPGLFAYNDLIERGGANVGDLFTAGATVPQYKRWDGTALTGNEYAEARQLGVGWQPRPATPSPEVNTLAEPRTAPLDPAGLARSVPPPGMVPGLNRPALVDPETVPVAAPGESRPMGMISPQMAAFAAAGSGLRGAASRLPALGSAAGYLNSLPLINNKVTRLPGSMTGFNMSAAAPVRGLMKALPAADLALQLYQDGIATSDQRTQALAQMQAGAGKGFLSNVTMGAAGNEFANNRSPLGQFIHGADQLGGMALTPIRSAGAIAQGAGDATAMGNAAKAERQALELQRQAAGLTPEQSSGYDQGLTWSDRRVQDVAQSDTARLAGRAATELSSAPGDEFEKARLEEERRAELMGKRIQSLIEKQQSGIQLTPVEQAELDRAGNQRHDPGLSYSQRAVEDVAKLPAAGFGSLYNRRPIVLPGTDWNLNPWSR